MGLCLDTENGLGLEIRRESICITDETGDKEGHIFATGDGHVEISKEYLRKMLEFFERPENKKYLEEGK